MKKQEKLVFFAKIFAVVGVIALVLLVGFGEKEESFIEPPKPTQIAESTDNQIETEVVQSTNTGNIEETEEKQESEISEEEQTTNQEEEEQEDTVVVLPFVPAQ